MAIIEVAIKPGDVPGMFRVDVVRSPAGEASATVELDVDGLLAKRQRLQETVLASAVTSRRMLPRTEQLARKAGQALFAGLLGAGDIAGRYQAAAEAAAKRGKDYEWSCASIPRHWLGYRGRRCTTTLRGRTCAGGTNWSVIFLPLRQLRRCGSRRH